jgi:hypothetical protein
MNGKFIFLLLISLLISSCTCRTSKRKIFNGENAEATIHVASGSASIVGLYKFIFSKHCDVRGCHDGTFEPNFTTIQSSYYTLVYHPIIKNNRINSFKYRVVPYDTSKSVLYERITNCCFVNDNDRMPQFSDIEKLSAAEIECVGKWIMDGAKNIDDKTYKPQDIEKH